MAEPHASTVAGAFTGAGISISGGMLLGAQIDALAVGLLAALFVSFWLESIDNRLKAAAAVLFSSLLAGYGSPVLAAWAASSVPGMAGVSPGLRLLGALCIGALAPVLVPVIMRRLVQLIEVANP